MAVFTRPATNNQDSLSRAQSRRWKGIRQHAVFSPYVACDRSTCSALHSPHQSTHTFDMVSEKHEAIVMALFPESDGFFAFYYASDLFRFILREDGTNCQERRQTLLIPYKFGHYSIEFRLKGSRFPVI